MPELDGFRTAEQINALFGNKFTILMFTSVDFRNAADKMKEFGVTDYLVKPVKRKELLDKILSTVTHNSENLVKNRLKKRKETDVKVLVVEDNEISMDVLVKMIRTCGNFNIIQATNGEEAIEPTFIGSK